MAEFQEVMRQWVRVRKATASNADEENVLSVYPLEAYDNNLIASIEKNVMKWAAEHPEPVYPTWGDWLMEQGILVPDTTCTNMKHWYAVNYIKISSPIPADIAKKLGIEPEEAR